MKIETMEDVLKELDQILSLDGDMEDVANLADLIYEVTDAREMDAKEGVLAEQDRAA